MPKGVPLDHRLSAESLLFVGLTGQLFYNKGLKQVRDCNPEFQVIASVCRSNWRITYRTIIDGNKRKNVD